MQKPSAYGCNWQVRFSSGDASRKNVFAGGVIHLILQGILRG
jgi:hypothetical protein